MPNLEMGRRALFVGLLFTVAFANQAFSDIVYLFEGVATSATERVLRLCAGPCDDPNPPLPTDLTRDDIVTEYTNVTFRVAFLAVGITELIPTQYDGSWADTSRYLAADSAVQTTSLFYGDPSLNTVTQTIDPDPTSTGPLYLHVNADNAPSFGQVGAVASFDPGTVAGAPDDFFDGGVWRWNFGAADPDPFAARTQAPVTMQLGPNPDFQYIWHQTVQDIERTLSIIGISSLTLTTYSATELPPPPVAVPAGGMSASLMLALILLTSALLLLRVYTRRDVVEAS